MKDTRISVRLSPELKRQVLEACALTGLDEPTVIRECLKAFVEEVATTGEVRLPLALIPKSKKLGSQNTEGPKAKPAVGAQESATGARTALPPSGSTTAFSLNESDAPPSPRLTERPVIRYGKPATKKP